jgi:tetratricopeptide (TPR) repeat protein
MDLHRIAGAACQNGDWAGAERLVRALLAVQPNDGHALFMLGVVLLNTRRYAEAESACRAAIQLAPMRAATHTNLGTALKRLDRLDDAVACFREASALLRGYPPRADALIEPGQAEIFRFAAPLKLRHDIAQLDYLIENGALPPSFGATVDAYRTVLDELDDGRDPAMLRPLNASQIARLGATYNRLVYRPPDEAPSSCLNPALDAARIEAAYDAASPPIVVVDDLLSDAALAAIRRFCLEATIWFDCKQAGGYLGAYLHDGFDAPVLIRLAHDLRTRLPNLLGPHSLAQAWAFKYAPGGTGTRPHADDAAVNVNLWITPDEARRDGTPGGLRLHDVAVPEGWSFGAYNRDPAALNALVRAAGRAALDVPYRCNRAVIFDSRLIHETLPYDFRSAYAEHRINLTLLFGERPRGA